MLILDFSPFHENDNLNKCFKHKFVVQYHMCFIPSWCMEARIDSSVRYLNDASKIFQSKTKC
jgi:hypothetical protein